MLKLLSVFLFVLAPGPEGPDRAQILYESEGFYDIAFSPELNWSFYFSGLNDPQPPEFFANESHFLLASPSGVMISGHVEDCSDSTEWTYDEPVRIFVQSVDFKCENLGDGVIAVRTGKANQPFVTTVLFERTLSHLIINEIVISSSDISYRFGPHSTRIAFRVECFREIEPSLFGQETNDCFDLIQA